MNREREPDPMTSEFWRSDIGCVLNGGHMWVHGTISSRSLGTSEPGQGCCRCGALKAQHEGMVAHMQDVAVFAALLPWLAALFMCAWRVSDVQ